LDELAFNLSRDARTILFVVDGKGVKINRNLSNRSILSV